MTKSSTLLASVVVGLLSFSIEVNATEISDFLASPAISYTQDGTDIGPVVTPGPFNKSVSESLSFSKDAEMNAIFVIGKDVTFSAPTITVNDSIDNRGSLTFIEGDTTVNGTITNTGTLSFRQGDTTLNNTVTNSGTINFEKGIANFDNTTWSGATGTVNFTGAEAGIRVTATTPSTLITADTVSGAPHLVVDNGVIDEAGKNLSITATTNNLTFADNALYNIDPETDGSGNPTGVYAVSQRTSADIATQGYSQVQADLLKAMLSVSVTDNPYFNSIATLVQMGQDTAAKSALEGLRPATAAANQAAFEATISTVRAIYNHIVPANDPEILAGMRDTNHITPWIEGMYTHSRNDMDNQGFQMHQAGFAMGLDTFISSNVLLGIGYSQITGRFEADVGGQTDLDGYTGFIYGSWKPSRWFISAMANYSKMKYDHSGITWDADVYGAQSTVGYEWGWIDAGVGVRYIRVESDQYTNAYGTQVDTKDADVVTGLVGVHVQKVFKDDHGWRLVPSVHAAVTYDIKQADDEAGVAYNGQHLYTFVGEKQKRVGAEIGASLKLTNGPAEVSLSYEGAFRKEAFSNGGYLTLKYHF